MPRTMPPAASCRSLVPHAGIESVLRRERRYLHAFFSKLAEADIVLMSDLSRYSASELFSIAPTSSTNRERFMAYVHAGKIDLRNEP